MPASTPANPNTPQRDPFDRLVDAVPPHIWASTAALAAMLLIGFLFFRAPSPAVGPAEGASRAVQGRVLAVLEASAAGPGVQRLLVELTAGDQRGQRVEIEYGAHQLAVTANRLQPGDRVLVESASGGPYGERYFISDRVRLPGLLALVALFALLTIVVGQWVGLRALVSIGISVVALAAFFIPGFIAGHDPLLVAVVGATLLMTATQYLIHQWRPKTHAALLGMVLSFVLASLATQIFGRLVHLSGLGSEDAVILLTQPAAARINPQGLLWAGILIGAVGVLDDVAVGQASAIFELRRANPALGWRQLFNRGMVVGRDHIASLVNTLLLAYVGAALPLFLLLTSQSLSLAETLNREFLAEEIVRTLVGSSVLILAVPITSLIASLAAAARWGDADPDSDAGSPA